MAGALAIKLTPSQRPRDTGNQTPVAAAFDAFLKGWEYHRRGTPEDLVKALPFFEQAIERDPRYGRAYAAAAMVYARIYLWRWHSQFQMARSEAKSKALEFLQSAPRNKTALGHQAASLLSEADGQHPEALAELRKAIALEPGDSWSYALTAFVLTSSGRPQEAEPYIRTALRLDPKPPSFFMYVLGLTFSLHNFKAAAAAAETSVKLNSEDECSLLLWAAAYGNLDLKQEAAASVKNFDQPSLRHGIPATVSTTAFLDFGNPEDRERLYRGLRAAGVPESPTGIPNVQKVASDEIHSRLLGHRLRVRTLETGKARGILISPDGRASGAGFLGGGNQSEGKVSIEGNELCFSHQESSYCGVVLKIPGGIRAKGNEFVWYRADQTFTFSSWD